MPPPNVLQVNSRMPLLRAHQHQWGPGAIHLVSEGNKTLCGKEGKLCPGTIIFGELEDVTCKVCLRSRESSLKASAARERWQAEYEQHQRQKLAYERQWWAAYDAYLQSEEWLEKRRLVLKRTGGLCEGCAKARAAQVHHRKYPANCLPGSAEWRKAEKLFDLVGVCLRCHQELHPNQQ